MGRAPSVLREFHCESVQYEFELPLDSFNSKSFFEKTGIKANVPWSAVLTPKHRYTGYHVHFKGRIEKNLVTFTIEYWDGGKPRSDDEEPFAESVMQWIGSFVRPSVVRAAVTARFDKPKDSWRSRFNLPFKVTMVGSEVTIDGVSLILPQNPFRALNAFVAVNTKTFYAAVDLTRSVAFANFDIRDEIAAFNDAIKIFLEHLA